MPGSMVLAAMGAINTGVGKLIIATTEKAAAMACLRVPEATYLYNGLEKCANGEIPDGIRAAAIGPGIVDYPLAEDAINNLMKLDIPIVLDAGALSARKYPKRKAVTVLTPHPGEFARILGLTAEDVQRDRISLASRYAQEQQVIVVLKGAETVIAFPDGSGFINSSGNPGLAKGGSGDTLTGMILAFLCTESEPYSAVSNAVLIHGLAGDMLRWSMDERAISAGKIAEITGKTIKNLLQ